VRLPADELVIEGRGGELGARTTREPAAEQRANQLRGEAQANRILFVAEEGLPVVSVYTQAATAEGAVVLARAAANGLVAYLEDLQSSRRVPERRKVEFRTLGEPQGGPVNEGASKVVAVLAFLSVLTAWCLGLLLLSGVLEGLRESKRRAASGLRPLDFEAEPEVTEQQDALADEDAVLDFERHQRVG
jgi:hypothetical protein